MNNPILKIIPIEKSENVYEIKFASTVKEFSISSRRGDAFKLAFRAEDFARGNFKEIPCIYEKTGLSLADHLSVYVKDASVGDVIEIEEWT